MEPTGVERHGRKGRTAERAGATESNALQDPVRVVGRLCQTPPPLSRTAALVCRDDACRSSAPLRISSENVPQLTAIRPSRLAIATGERLHRLHRVYQRIPVEPAIC